MPIHTETNDARERSLQRQTALMRWDNEGGAGPSCLRAPGGSVPDRLAIPPLEDAELVQLQIRVIALENLVVTLLAASPDGQVALARDAAAYITPRPGFTAHRLTLHAAAQIRSLGRRAVRFRALRPGLAVRSRADDAS